MSRIITDWSAIVSYMNDELREDLHHDLAPCTEAEFLKAYLEREKDFEGEDLKGILENEFNIDDAALQDFFNGVMYYRILSRVGDGDVFESKIYTNKAEAVRDCQSEYDCLTEHDKKRYSEYYVAEYDCLADAEEVLADHNSIYSALSCWCDNLLTYTGLNRTQFCKKYNIPYGSFEKWQYGTRECPEYVKELLSRVVKIDF